MGSDPAPLLSKETPFPGWKSDCKGWLRRHKCSAPIGCENTKEAKAKLDADVVEQCAGHLWGMLAQDIKPLVKEHEDDPTALWAALDALEGRFSLQCNENSHLYSQG